MEAWALEDVVEAIVYASAAILFALGFIAGRLR
jgi:hypothetical protein